MGWLRKRNRRKSTGRRIELPELEWTRAGRIAGALLALAALGVLLALGLDQPVRSIVIDGPFQRVAAVEVEQAARGALTGGFVSADLEKLREAVEALAWVDRARVQRLWPDRVREKCKADKSLAIAHGLEHLYVEPEAQPKKTRGRKKAGGDE